jgi:hypothetical protein
LQDRRFGIRNSGFFRISGTRISVFDRPGRPSRALPRDSKPTVIRRAPPKRKAAPPPQIHGFETHGPEARATTLRAGRRLRDFAAQCRPPARCRGSGNNTRNHPRPRFCQRTHSFLSVLSVHWKFCALGWFTGLKRTGQRPVPLRFASDGGSGISLHIIVRLQDAAIQEIIPVITLGRGSASVRILSFPCFRFIGSSVRSGGLRV